MKHRSEPHAFEERPKVEKARIAAALESTGLGPQSDWPELRQIETALHIDGFVSSAGLQPPKLTLG